MTTFYIEADVNERISFADGLAENFIRKAYFTIEANNLEQAIKKSDQLANLCSFEMQIKKVEAVKI